MLVSKEKLERDFAALLRRLQPHKETIASFPKIATKVWTQKQGDAEAMKKRLLTRLEEQKRLKAELLKAKLRGEVTQADYQQANAEFTDEVTTIEEQLEVVQSSKTKLESFVRFAELMLVDIAGAWQRAVDDQRQRVQNLLFFDGVLYSEDRGFLNTPKPSLFTVLEGVSTENGMLASPTGFETRVTAVKVVLEFVTD